MDDWNGQRLPWRLFLSELVGTAVLVLVGLSLVIVMFGEGNPVAPVVPNEALRRLITGFLFGTTGVLIALSPVGKVLREPRLLRGEAWREPRPTPTTSTAAGANPSAGSPGCRRKSDCISHRLETWCRPPSP
jgi:hypothetical protein